MKKRSLTLLEVMVALGLAAMLLGTLFTFYRQLFQTRAELQKSKETVFQRVWLQERLSQLFGRILAEKEGMLFYTARPNSALGQALYFYYDNGIDPDPAYCHQVSGMLYLGEDKQLKLCTFPDRVETLMEKVGSIKMLFFDSRSKEWQAEWAQDKSDLPPMIKIIVHQENEVEYVFFLPHAYKKIDYTQIKSRFEILQGGALNWRQATPAPKQLNLSKLSDAGGLKFDGCPTRQKTNLHLIWV